MDIDFAKGLVDESPSGEVTLRENYSGRGMFGRVTAAVVFPQWKDFCEALVYYTALHTRQGDDTDEIADAVSRLKLDDMGRSIIAY